MKVLISSFGINSSLAKWSGFYQMPPIKMSKLRNKFQFNYELLLFAEKLIIDRESYFALVDKNIPLYEDVRDILRRLYDEGFIQLENYTDVLQANKDFLEILVENDLKNVDIWRSPFNTSLEKWSGFTKELSDINDFKSWITELAKSDINVARNYLTHSPASSCHQSLNIFHINYHFIQNMRIAGMGSEEIEPENEDLFFNEAIYRKTLGDYLAYVNANLVLSNHFDCGFEDWDDFTPFYKAKFLNVGKEHLDLEREGEVISQFFDISFPEFSHWTPDKIVKSLKDTRLNDLRNLISEAVANNVKFDRDFGVRILNEVLTVEHKVARMRSIASYITAPIGLIPVAGNPLQKIAEESAGYVIEKKLKAKYNWFYFVRQYSGY